MKLSTFATLFALSTALAAVLEPRQQCSMSDACYSAVFGDGSFSRVVQAVEDCEDFLTTSVIWHPMYVNAPLGDVYLGTRTDHVYCSITLTVLSQTVSTTTSPCPPTVPVTPSEALPQSTVSQGKRLVVRQALPTDFSTTTVFGPRPSYATQACNSGAYSSACSCANITTALVSYLGTVSKLVDVEGDWTERKYVLEC
ncbi:hypothetical protein COCMIDRAFT_94368 [Bipolaris oryzae ATCC 44560]|uniref:Uncharacterized protein n=1 Tax=Bipolaris oryzae ATCC 44560 TaxID=930090 RepID=W6Z7V7_COCMI|nr:uncharacterized protein COCMIDRAFT_94368 [Bipolaris oryzae ATCC 44560]EUC45858.1 hypothetical protein COCMIDRAFT_94368 [Bipolaris oryzae ATCC 44560]